MIVDLTIPANVTRVLYGQASMIPDAGHQIQVPAYVAKTLLTLVGVTGPALDESAADLLAAAAADFEANYLLLAYGKPLLPENKCVAAASLMALNGEPAVSMS